MIAPPTTRIVSCGRIPTLPRRPRRSRCFLPRHDRRENESKHHERERARHTSVARISANRASRKTMYSVIPSPIFADVRLVSMPGW